MTLVGGDALLAEQTARREGERSGREYASPYNDPAVIAGRERLAWSYCGSSRASMPYSSQSAVEA